MSVNNPSENVSDRFRVCSFVFIKIKRKRNLKGEFMKIFKEVFNQKVLPDDGLPRAIFDTCRYRIETSWKRNCNWEVTDSKKKNGMPLSWQQLKRLRSFVIVKKNPEPSLNNWSKEN